MTHNRVLCGNGRYDVATDTRNHTTLDTAADQDGGSLTVTTDDAGRVKTVERTTLRGIFNLPRTLTATFNYDAAGRVTSIDYGNGTRVVRDYDDADRPTLIRYESAAGMGQGRPLHPRRQVRARFHPDPPRSSPV